MYNYVEIIILGVIYMMKIMKKNVLFNINCVIKKYMNIEFNRVFNIYFVFKKEENDKLKLKWVLYWNYLFKNVFVYFI